MWRGGAVVAAMRVLAGALLERSASAGQAAIMRGIAKEVAPIPLWGGEVNSCSCGGCPNVSDTFAAALWALDFLSELSKAGVQVNFHGGPTVHPPCSSS
jgi:hypothetical protein